MTEVEKIAELEHSVLFDTPEELDRTCKLLGNIKCSSRALGLACKFRGLEWAKVLVKNNVVFRYSDMRERVVITYATPNRRAYFSLFDDFIFSLVKPDIYLKRTGCSKDSIIVIDRRNTAAPAAPNKEFAAVSEEERFKCAEYFIELDNYEICDLQKLLYLAIMNFDLKVTGLLREKGTALSKSACDMLTDKRESDHYSFWDFCSRVYNMTADEFIWTITELSKDIDEDKSINISTWLLDNIRKYFYELKAFECILAHFNQKKINKKKTMEEIILLDKPELLPICEKHGWLRMPKKRDQLIQFATDNKKTECTAWLLEFKNRTANLKEEKEKAEKRLMQELNANPNSLTELKKVWGFEKREDGGIIITRYKGKRTEIVVPEKIGDMTVKEIGAKAFSPDAPRLREEQVQLRLKITRVNLPETVEVIGEYAFSMCEMLSEINIPKNVKEIGESAFYNCKSIVKLDIPESVSKIGASVFASCTGLISARLPEGITEIGNGTFSRCEALQKVTIPQSVKFIGKWAFLWCVSLENLIIPDSVEEIGEKAFAYCEKLKSLNLPKSVMKIKNRSQKGREPETIFSEDKKLTVTVSAKSYAEKYCKRNNIPYEILKED